MIEVSKGQKLNSNNSTLPMFARSQNFRKKNYIHVLGNLAYSDNKQYAS